MRTMRTRWHDREEVDFRRTLEDNQVVEALLKEEATHQKLEGVAREKEAGTEDGRGLRVTIEIGSVTTVAKKDT